MNRIPASRHRAGLTLLEVMVALAILGMVVLGYLQAFAGTFRLAEDGTDWTRAVGFAEAEMEEMKIFPLAPANDESASDEPAPGFRRWVAREHWRDGTEIRTVVVTLPRGARLEISRAFSASGQIARAFSATGP
jgi:prepilin-type N-terminal cleavage/methylation domain-containing protein